MACFGAFSAFQARAQAPGVRPPVCEPIIVGSLDGYAGFRYPSWNMARLNPLDNQQLVAVRSEAEGPAVHRNLYWLDLRTHQQKLLLRDVGCGLSWGRSGWVVLERGGRLWKLKANGDSLTQLPVAPDTYHPAWNPSGQLLACVQADSLNPEQSGIVLLRPSGKVAKHLAIGNIWVTSNLAWSPNGRKLAFFGIAGGYAGGPEYVYEFDLPSGQTRLLFKPVSYLQHGYNSLHWLPNGKELLWRAANSGLTTLHLASGRQRLIWQQMYLLSVDVDAKHSRLLVVRADSQLDRRGPGVGKLYSTGNLLTSAVNGSKQVPINRPATGR